MANIEQIKQLRQETGVSLMECRKALDKTNGDVEKAKKILRERGEELLGKRSDKDVGQGVIASYIHTDNKVGVLLDIRCESDFVAKGDDFLGLAHEICLQIAAAKPLYIKKEDVPEDIKEEEKDIILKQMKDEKKPADMMEKIIEGKLNKQLKKIVLLSQPWVKDENKQIDDLINEVIAKLGERVIVNKFERYEI